MADAFIGRTRELALLQRSLERVRAGGRAGRAGRAVLIRGRRRVGKSRLAEEFVERGAVPYLYFTASAQRSVQLDIRQFVAAGESSSLPGAAKFSGQHPADWGAAFSLLASALPTDQPSVVVIDEMPYLIANDSGFEGSLQKAFDREFSRKPVLLLGIGSDLAMMEALNEYGRPFHQRASEMVVPPLNPADIAGMLGLSAADAFDAFLVSGGLPLILDEWPHGARAQEYLADAVTDPTSALLVSGERSLAAEFPEDAQARRVLSAMGSGERTHALLGREADLPSASLTRALRILVNKRIVETLTPLSTKPSRETRYAVVDPHLRFWLTFLGPHISEVERGRGDLTLARITRAWTSWRGRVVEPVVRESLRRLPELLPDDTHVIGGYWTRTNNPEIDIVGADREPVAKKITVVGSIKWHDKKKFDSHDLTPLYLHRSQLPGATESTRLLAVSRVGCSVSSLDALTPDDLIAAW